MKYVNFFLKWLIIFVVGSLVAFGIVRLMSGDPVQMFLSVNNINPSPENIAYAKKQLGLDQSLMTQYLDWIMGFIKGDWGKSYMAGVDLKPEILRRLPISFTLGFGGLVYASILAFFLGFLAAIKDGFFNRFTRALALISQTIPVFILIILFVYFFGVKYKFIKFFSSQSLAVTLVGTFFVDVMKKPYYRFYVERGYPREKALLRYCYHEPLQGLFGLVISQAAYVIGASSVVEFALSIQGISTLLIESISHRDYLITQTYIMMIIIWMFFIHSIFNLFQSTFIKRGGSYE